MKESEKIVGGDSKIPVRVLTGMVLLLLPVIYFYPAITGEVALAQGDGWAQNLGVRVLIGKMIAGGHVPLWNPYIFAGTPLLASIYPGALYPPNWVFAVFTPGTAMNLVVITTYQLGLIGTYLYARRIGISRTASMIAGIAFIFGGYLIAHLGHTSRIAAAIWLPWILLAIENLFRRVSWKWVALGSIFIALQQFAGEPQMTFYTVLVCGAYCLFCLVRAHTQKSLSFVATTLSMAVCGVLLSMIQLLPQRELLRLGERSKISYEYFSAYSLPPRQVFTFLFPYFFGGAAKPPYEIVWWGQWTIDETCGYVGLMTLLFGLVAVIGRRRDPLVWFWMAVVLGALILAFGAYLPMGIYTVFHELPVYNLFRASARHMFEFTFGLGILAGLGVDWLMKAELSGSRRGLLYASIVMIAAVGLTSIAYLFFGGWMVAELPRSPLAGHVTNLELLIPLSVFIVTLAAAWFCLLQRDALGKTLLVVVLFADLLAFGHFFNWRVTTFNINDRIVDSEPVAFIKSREKDLNTFRIISRSIKPFGKNYEALNYPNVSIVRGLQSINGYDALRLLRMTAVAGEMTLDGLVTDMNAFSDSHKGFDLLNVKYMLRERAVEINPEEAFIADGILFNRPPKDLQFRQGDRLVMPLGNIVSSEIAVISNMANSTHLTDGTPVMRITLHTSDGRAIERQLQVGRDTAEWAYDRDDVRPVIKHKKPPIAEDMPAGNFSAHRYLARLKFERSEIESVEFEYLLSEAMLALTRISLFDAATGKSYPLDPVNESRARWRMLKSFDEVQVYENLTALPRAWFVRRAAVELSRDVIPIIRTGKMKDGSPYNPADTVLFEREDFGNREVVLPEIGDPAGAEVKVTKYEPQRIELETRNPNPGFLVLSEIYYRGWEAWVDGKRVPVERVDYALRGIPVPRGDHRIEFVFTAPTFRTGAIYSAVGALLLLFGGLFRRRMLWPFGPGKGISDPERQ